MREKTNSWERTTGQAGCGKETLQGYACKITEPTEHGHPRVVGIQGWLWAHLIYVQKTREGCGCFWGLFWGFPRKTPGKSRENCWKKFPEWQNATNSRISGTGKGKPAGNLGSTLPGTLSPPSEFQPSRVFLICGLG